MVDILNYFGMFMAGVVAGGVFVGWIVSKDINRLVDNETELNQQLFDANDKMRRLGIKEGE